MYFSPDLLGNGHNPVCVNGMVYYIDNNYGKLDSVKGLGSDPEWLELSGDGYFDYIQDSTSYFNIVLYQPENDSFAFQSKIDYKYLGSIDLNDDGISGYVAMGESFVDVTYSLSSLHQSWCYNNGPCYLTDASQWNDFLSVYDLETDYSVDVISDCNSVNYEDCRNDFLLEKNIDLPESIENEVFIDHFDGRGYRTSLGSFDTTLTKAISMDIDAQGKQELLLFASDTLKFIVHDFFPTLSGDSISHTFVIDTIDFIFSDDIRLGDFNGDGVTELVSNSSNKILSFVDSGIPGKMVSAIKNGLGIESRYMYKPLTDTAVYTPGSNAEYPVIDMIVPMYVTSSLFVDNGVVDSSYVEYDYRWAKVHTQGKGFLGFMETSVENDLLDTEFTSTSGYDTTYFVAYPKSSIKKVGGNSISETTTSISIDEGPEGGLQFRMATDTSIYHNKIEPTAITTTTTYSYNDDGLLSEKSMDVAGDATITEKYTYSNAGWYIATLPEYRILEHDRSGETTSDTVRYSFNSSNGKL